MDAIPDGYPKLIANIQRLLDLGRKDGHFHSRVDAVDLYISIAALGYHYFSNIYTLSALFNRDFSAPNERAARLQHIEDVILGYLLNGKKAAKPAARR
jgi:TetR/AcrR family transcriptional regulator